MIIWYSIVALDLNVLTEHPQSLSSLFKIVIEFQLDNYNYVTVCKRPPPKPLHCWHYITGSSSSDSQQLTEVKCGSMISNVTEYWFELVLSFPQMFSMISLVVNNIVNNNNFTRISLRNCGGVCYKETRCSKIKMYQQFLSTKTGLTLPYF